MRTITNVLSLVLMLFLRQAKLDAGETNASGYGLLILILLWTILVIFGAVKDFVRATERSVTND